jgi:hypothetical protein
MSERPCLIAAVDLNDQAAAVLRRASKLAALCRADLVVAHVVDYHSGYESDHAPFHTPSEVRSSLIRCARAWLLGLLHHLDIPALETVELVVIAGRPLDAIASLAAERSPQFIMTGRSAWGGFSPLAGLSRDPRVRAQGCDVLREG